MDGFQASSTKLTRVPFPGAEEITSSPPSRRTRSLMLMRPKRRLAGEAAPQETRAPEAPVAKVATNVRAPAGAAAQATPAARPAPPRSTGGVLLRTLTEEETVTLQRSLGFEITEPE